MRRNDPSVRQRVPSRALVPGYSASKSGHAIAPASNNQANGAEKVCNLASGYFRLSAVAGETSAEEDDEIGSIADDPTAFVGSEIREG